MKRPRRWRHRGRVELGGWWFPSSLYPEALIRARILRFWAPGAQVYRRSEGVALLFPKSKTFSVDATWGTPLVPERGCWWAGPWDPDEHQALQAPPGALILAHAGRTLVWLPSLEDRVDPADWVDFSAFEIVAVKPLGARPAPPRPVMAPALGDLKARLAPAAQGDSPERAAFLARLHQPTLKKEAAASRPGWRARLAQWLLNKLSTPKTVAAGPGSPGRSLRQRVLDWLGRLALATRLGSWFEKRHAEYLGRLMQMFDDNNLDQALRHAIPLSDLERSEPARPALGLPQPRAELRLDLNQTSLGAGGSLLVASDLFALLRQRYQKAAERLEQLGKIEDAAFVLADLLRDAQQAVALLERHGRHALAAELAEARKLPIAQVIRLWLLAGEHDRAVRLARERGAFAEAIALLEVKHPKLANSLRLLWADLLAESGSFSEAVNVVWPIEIARDLAWRWIETAVALGGPAGARMLHRGLLLNPDRQDLLATGLQWLDEDGPEGRTTRAALAESLSTEATPPDSSLWTLMRPAARALYRDAQFHSSYLERRTLQHLVRILDDMVFRTDLPPMVERAPETPVTVTFNEGEAGNAPIRDLRVLPDGKLLLAMGDGGVRLVTRDGRRIVHFDQPADRLVLSEQGHRALTRMRRGSRERLGRIDLVFRRASPWGELSIDAAADSFDGVDWLLCSQRSVVRLDATERNLAFTWRANDLCATHFVRTLRSTSFLVANEIWSYELPAMVLRARVRVEPRPDAHMSLSSNGELVELVPPEPAPLGDDRTPWQFWELRVGGHARGFLQLPPLARIGRVAANNGWIVVAMRELDQATVRAFELKNGHPTALVRFPGASEAHVWVDIGELIAWDDRGRMVRLDADLRVTHRLCLRV